jgi:hypothetical protein
MPGLRSTAQARPSRRHSVTKVRCTFSSHEIFNFFILAGPTITSISPSVVTGGSFVSIVGTGFGSKDYTLSASFGVTGCEYVTFISDSRINSKLSNGVGRNNFQVNVYGQYASISAAYPIPIIMKTNSSNLPCSSAAIVEILGIFFGTFDSTVKVGVAGTAGEFTRWHASSSIRCKFSRGFVSVTPVAISVDLQIGTVTFAISFDRPFISALSSFNAPCFSPGSLFIFGGGFGFPTLDATSVIGATESTHAAIFSDSAILSSIPPGTGNSLSVSMTIAGAAGSVTRFFSYDGTQMMYVGHMCSH